MGGASCLPVTLVPTVNTAGTVSGRSRKLLKSIVDSCYQKMNKKVGKIHWLTMPWWTLRWSSLTFFLLSDKIILSSAKKVAEHLLGFPIIRLRIRHWAGVSCRVFKLGNISSKHWQKSFAPPKKGLERDYIQSLTFVYIPVNIRTKPLITTPGKCFGKTKKRSHLFNPRLLVETINTLQRLCYPNMVTCYIVPLASWNCCGLHLSY